MAENHDVKLINTTTSSTSERITSLNSVVVNLAQGFSTGLIAPYIDETYEIEALVAHRVDCTSSLVQILVKYEDDENLTWEDESAI